MKKGTNRNGKEKDKVENILEKNNMHIKNIYDF